MLSSLYDSILNLDLSQWLAMVTSPSFKTLQLAIVVYVGILWLSIIIWVTRDAISRSNSLIFQVFAILLNIGFPVLGTLLYLIIRPGKTVMERYYEELEHRLILESIQGKTQVSEAEHHPLKVLRKKAGKKWAKKEETEEHPGSEEKAM
jgi:ABC-type multidrug transport system fused ATPase/permease subunit